MGGSARSLWGKIDEQQPIPRRLELRDRGMQHERDAGCSGQQRRVRVPGAHAVLAPAGGKAGERPVVAHRESDVDPALGAQQRVVRRLIGVRARGRVRTRRLRDVGDRREDARAATGVCDDRAPRHGSWGSSHIQYQDSILWFLSRRCRRGISFPRLRDGFDLPPGDERLPNAKATSARNSSARTSSSRSPSFCEFRLCRTPGLTYTSLTSHLLSRQVLLIDVVRPANRSMRMTSPTSVPTTNAYKRWCSWAMFRAVPKFGM